MITSKATASIVLVGLLASAATSAPAQPLPALGDTVTVSGDSNAARFYGGVQANGTVGFVSQVLPQDELMIRLSIDVDPQDVGRAGNLFLVAEVGGVLLMGTPNGFPQWDLTLEGLQPLVAGKLLSDTETIIVLDKLSPASVDVENASLALLAGYSLATDQYDIVHHTQPLLVEIGDYDPLQHAEYQPEVIDTVVPDTARQRDIPVLIYLPESSSQRPVILFSHGLGGSRFAATYLGEHWARRGYVGVFMQHPGSDASILEGVPPSQILEVLNEAANGANSVARIEDVSAVLDALELWNGDSDSPLHGRLDLTRVGMSGHSYGARTTQSVSGQTGGLFNLQEPRIDAAVILSPSVPVGISPEAAFGSVELPWMLMTGTNDTSVVGNTTVADRLAVYPALPPGEKYELVLFEGEHHAFSDGPLNATQAPRNPAHHPMIMALSTSFWDAWLQGFPGARRWLEGEPARAILQPGDSWLFK